MIVSRVARRYADAMYRSVPTDPGMESFLRDLADIRISISQSRELENFFTSPVITMIKKLDIVRALFTGRVHAFTLGVLLFLIVKGREGLVQEIAHAVLELHRKAQGIEATEVTTATDLSPEQRTLLEKQLQSMTGKRLDASYSTNPEILGGAIVRVGDTVYDGSVQRQLLRLHKSFLT